MDTVRESSRLAFNAALREHTQSLHGAVLDVGSGPYLRHRELLRRGVNHIGIDIAEGGVAGRYVRMDATKMGFPDGTFDNALCLETLEHVQDAEAAVAEIARVLRPGGRVVVSVPTVWTWPFQFGRHGPRYFTTRKLAALLRAHLSDVEVIAVGGPATWLAQLLKNWVVLVPVRFARDREKFWHRVDAVFAPLMRAAYSIDGWLPRLLPVHYVARATRAG